MFGRDTLMGQINICVLFSFLPIMIFFYLDINGYSESVSMPYLLTFALVPLFIFYFLFGTMKKGKGYEFKRIRLLIVTLLWIVYLSVLLFLLSVAANFTEEINTLLTSTIGHAVAIPIVVTLSYRIGKWIHSKTGGKLSV